MSLTGTRVIVTLFMFIATIHKVHVCRLLHGDLISKLKGRWKYFLRYLERNSYLVLNIICIRPRYLYIIACTISYIVMIII